jgi:hypothetical protein
MGIGNGEGVTLDVVVVVRDDTDDTVVEFGWRLAELFLETDLGEEGRLGPGLTDPLAINIIWDRVRVTLLSEDKGAEVTFISLMASVLF